MRESLRWSTLILKDEQGVVRHDFAATSSHQFARGGQKFCICWRGETPDMLADPRPFALQPDQPAVCLDCRNGVLKSWLIAMLRGFGFAA